MFANNYVSTLIERQLPDFIRGDESYSNFVLLLKKYYEYMEQEDKTIYTGKRLYDYADVDSTRDDLLKYFKEKYIPSFPDRTELSTAKLVKASRDFYAKKGTPDGLKFLFRVLYGQEAEVYFPKADILRASDGKWKLPQALRISISDTLTLVEGSSVSVLNATANVVSSSGNLISYGIAANASIQIDSEKRNVVSVNAAGDFLRVDVPFKSSNTTYIYQNQSLYKIQPSEYKNFNFELLEKRRGIGEVSRSTCVIETANRTVDKDTGREIVELYVSNVKRPFQTNENLLIEYVDPNTNNTSTFSSEIISLISGINLTRNRLGVIQNGKRYVSGDPVILYSGLSNSIDSVKAVATVGNVSTAQLESVALVKRGYLFRDYPNSLIQIVSNSGIGANLIIGSVSEDPSEYADVTVNTDTIYFKRDVLLSNASYGFDNFTFANINTSLALAFSTDTIRMGRINVISLVDTGSFFDQTPTLEATSVYDTDFTEQFGLITISPGQFSNYNRLNNSIQLSYTNPSFSSSNGIYTGARLFLDTGDASHYVNVIDYVVLGGTTQTKTLFLDRNFENNINDTNIQNYVLKMDLRADVHNLGKLSAIEIINGGSGYQSTDQIVFTGIGYDATATLTVSGGVITGATLVNRGEGYYGGSECLIVNASGGPSTGTGAQLFAYQLSDGEVLRPEVGELGQIQSFDIINRGYNYSTAPIVSLKVADILTDNLSFGAVILTGSGVWQGSSTNANSTFNAIVDSIYRVGNTAVIRVFNYNGSLNVAEGLRVNTSTGNATVNISVSNASISFGGINPAIERSYPKFYGDGLAKAEAQFLNGLIRYSGFYLNTDGFLSADKKLQNGDYYHNFSYEIQSEKPLEEYKDSIYKIAHPAGMQLLSKFLIKDNLDDKIQIRTDIGVSNSAAFTNVITSYTSNLVFGNNSNFSTTTNVGDVIVINSSNNAQNRIYSKVVTFVDPVNDLIRIETPIGGLGDGRLILSSGSSAAKVYANNDPVSDSLAVSDLIRINVNSVIYNLTVASVSGNTVTFTNTSPVTANTLYEKLPSYTAVNYKIIKPYG